MQNELNNDVGRFTTHIKPVLQQIKLLTGLNVGGKTQNAQQRYSTRFAAMLQNKLHFFVARVTKALVLFVACED